MAVAMAMAEASSEWDRERSSSAITDRCNCRPTSECQCVLRHFKTPEMKFGSLQITDSGSPLSLSPFIWCSQSKSANIWQGFHFGCLLPVQRLATCALWHATNWSKIDKILARQKMRTASFGSGRKYAVQLHWRLQTTKKFSPRTLGQVPTKR